MKKPFTFLLAVLLYFSCSKKDATPASPPAPPPPPVATVSMSGFSPASAAVDSVVTITGNNFSTDGTKDIVKFNDTLAVVSSATATQLVVTVPAGASTGKITVTVGAQTVTSTGTFTVADHWTLRTSFPGTYMASAVSFAVGRKLYVGLGKDANSGTWLTEFWQYDADADSWKRMADFPGSNIGLGVGFCIGNKGYVVNIPDNSGNCSLWQYDTASDSWAQKTSLPGSYQFGIVAFGLNNFGYVGLGYSPGYPNNSFWRYDPVTNTWTQKKDYPGTATAYAASFVIGNYGYVGTGTVNRTTSTGSVNFFRYDPSLDSWTQKADFPGAGRDQATGFAVGNYGYLQGGNSVNGAFGSDFWQYDPSADKWTRKGDFPGGIRTLAAGFSGSSQGYLGFGTGSVHETVPGQANNTYVDLWQYQP